LNPFKVKNNTEPLLGQGGDLIRKNVIEINLDKVEKKREMDSISLRLLME